MALLINLSVISVNSNESNSMKLLNLLLEQTPGETSSEERSEREIENEGVKGEDGRNRRKFSRLLHRFLRSERSRLLSDFRHFSRDV